MYLYPFFGLKTSSKNDEKKLFFYDFLGSFLEIVTIPTQELHFRFFVGLS